MYQRSRNNTYGYLMQGSGGGFSFESDTFIQNSTVVVRAGASSDGFWGLLAYGVNY
jgi:hypothetical protein